MKHVLNKPRRRGFSLVEVVIAIGIVAILLTTFLAVFGPAQRNIQRSLSVKDANRLVSTLENEMSILRNGEGDNSGGSYTSSFDKAFEWIKESGSKDSAILIYQYNAQAGTDDSNFNADDTPMPYNVGTEKGIPGRDYITQTVVRFMDDAKSKALMEKELVPGVVEGPVYVVRMTQLVKDTATDGLKVGTIGTITSDDGTNVSDSALFPEAAIVFQAEFFRLRSNLKSYVTGNNWNFDDKLGKPVSVTNIGVRR